VSRLILIALLFAMPVMAGPTPEMLELGKKEFEAGSRDFDLGNYDRAFEHFEASYKLTGKPALLFNITRVHEYKYRRNKDIHELEAAIERVTMYLNLTANETDPNTLALRTRSQAELQKYKNELARVKAERAKGEEALQVGEEALEAGRFADALAQVDKFERNPGNERTGVVRAYVLRAFVAFATKDLEGSAGWFARALSLDKSLSLPKNAPVKLQQVFDDAQGRLQGKDIERVLHTTPGNLKPGQPVTLTFAIASDPEHLVKSIKLYYRLTGGRAYSKMEVPATGKVTLPALFTQQLQSGTKIDYYADVLDQNAAYLEHIGTNEVPFTVMIGKPPGVPIAKRWWFWTTVGVVAAGVALGAGLGYYYTRPAPPPPDLSINTGSQALHGGRF
jgi:hypothetical protein